MTVDWAGLMWPQDRLDQAVDLLARHVGVEGSAAPESVLVGLGSSSPATVLAQLALARGVDVEAVTFTYAMADLFVARLGPSLVPLANIPGLLVVLEGGRRWVTVVDPGGQRRRVAAGELRQALRAPAEAKVAGSVDALLGRVSLSASAARRARRVMLDERLAGAPLTGGWQFQLPAGSPLRLLLRRAGLLKVGATLVASHLGTYLLMLLAWWLLGLGTLSGRMDKGWLWACAWVMLTALPLHLVALQAESTLAVMGGMLMRRRLLTGILRFQPDRIRHEGFGGLLGRVLDAEAVEALALQGGFAAALALVELLCAVGVLVGGAANVATAAVVVLCAGWVGWEGVREYTTRRTYTQGKVAVTQELVEGMLGHRTRLVQEDPRVRHRREDALLQRDFAASAALDAHAVRLGALAPRVTLLAGLATLAPVFLEGPVVAGAWAVSLGGLLLATAAMRRLVGGITSLSAARVAFEGIRPMFEAAAAGPAPLTHAPSHAGPGQPILVATGLGYQHAGRGEPVLQNTQLTIHHGDRILLQGASGGGKSTLAALLAGLRTPQRGLLLLHGFDVSTLGENTWRSRVALAPQFHENHIFAGSLLYNLLMGRRWPPTRGDIEEAQGLCAELALDGLINRMPGGMEQMVGETGWQLSHGERSRVFLARALLQGADVIVLDESFAALDSATLDRALECVLRRAPTLVVVAHP
jgi:ATP-binding cassette subfamily B protein